MANFPATVDFRISFKVFRQCRMTDIPNLAGSLDLVGKLETAAIGRKQHQAIRGE